MSARAYVSLGSNLGDRAGHLADARTALVRTESVRLVALSSVAETEPVDVIDQPDFLNQVAGLDTALEPRPLLDALLAAEVALGRVREGTPPRGPRTIDLDLLLYDDRAIDEPGLVVPHPRLHRRPFLLELLREAGAPAAWIPSGSPA